jgi:hypothetical protein
MIPNGYLIYYLKKEGFMDNKIIEEVNCKYFIDRNYFGLIDSCRKGQCSACCCALVERTFCNSGECKVKENE